MLYLLSLALGLVAAQGESDIELATPPPVGMVTHQWDIDPFMRNDPGSANYPLPSPQQSAQPTMQLIGMRGVEAPLPRPSSVAAEAPATASDVWVMYVIRSAIPTWNQRRRHCGCH